MANDRNWGGRREGAGRPPRGWKIVPHRKRFLTEGTSIRVAMKLRREIPLGLVARRTFERFRAVWNQRKVRIEDVVYDEKKGRIVFRLGLRRPLDVAEAMHLIAIRFVARLNRALGRTGRALAERYRVLSKPMPEMMGKLLRDRMKDLVMAVPNAAGATIVGIVLAGIATGTRRSPLRDGPPKGWRRG